MRILITDPLSARAVEALEAAGFVADVQLEPSDKQLRHAAAEADAWLVRSGTRITADLIAAAPRLRVIGRAGVGVDNVDLDAATRRGILVLNAPDGNTISTAEHTCAMILALARRIPHAHASVQRGAWERARFAGAELEGKAVGVIGLGKIGSAVAARLGAFNVQLVGYDPVVSADVAERLGVRLVELDALFEQADIITLHPPLNDATRNLLDAARLQRCKPGVWVINCARGGLVDERALYDALESGHVGGAALDVFSEEPPGSALRPLLQHPRVVVTPHIAASTEEAQEKVALQVAAAVIDALRGLPVATSVNAGAIRAAAQPEVRPFLELADRLGQLAAQLAEGPIQRVAVRCAGETVHRHAEVLAVGALRGLLAHWRDEPVNLINAPLLAREAGLEVEEQRVSEATDFTNLVELRLETEAGARHVKGTVFEQTDARLVEVDGLRFEVRLEGFILFYRNVDRPGMVAQVGAILAEQNINIASLALGRSGPGEEAVSAFSVDEEIPREVLARIAAIEGVRQVQFVRLG